MPLENPLSNERSSALSPQSHDDFNYSMLTGRLEGHESCRVLVVDDDAIVRARLSTLLSASRYEVEVAATAEEALRILDATHCHIVLTDWQMPDMDGLALCRVIRLRNYGSYVYVLMLTIRDTEHDVLAGLAAGADAYVVKGATSKDILARVEIARRITSEKTPVSAINRGDRSISHADPLTGAHNLDYLMLHLPRELARSQRHGHALAILNCGIDGFYRFQDRFGHGAANELLREFVASAGGCIRKGDWLARIGGAAFVIVLPETAAKGAHRAAQKLRQLFNLHPQSAPDEPVGFTVSIEVTAVEAGQDAESTSQVEAVLRAAVRETYANGRLDSDQASADTMACTSEPGAPIGGKNGLN
jgi:two-component system cell cycle response regulator